MQYRMHFPALNTEMIKYECTVMQKPKKKKAIKPNVLIIGQKKREKERYF